MKFVEIEPGLLVSNCGRVFKESTYFERGSTKIRYKAICYKGNKKDIHRLVAEAFIPNEEAKPCVMHLDDNPKNNRVENLMWATHRENMEDMHKKGRWKSGSKKCSENALKRFQLIILPMIIDGKKNREIAAVLNVSESRINQIIKKFGMARLKA